MHNQERKAAKRSKKSPKETRPYCRQINRPDWRKKRSILDVQSLSFQGSYQRERKEVYSQEYKNILGIKDKEGSKVGKKTLKPLFTYKIRQDRSNDGNSSINKGMIQGICLIKETENHSSPINHEVIIAKPFLMGQSNIKNTSSRYVYKENKINDNYNELKRNNCFQTTPKQNNSSKSKYGVQALFKGYTKPSCIDRSFSPKVSQSWAKKQMKKIVNYQNGKIIKFRNRNRKEIVVVKRATTSVSKDKHKSENNTVLLTQQKEQKKLEVEKSKKKKE